MFSPVWADVGLNTEWPGQDHCCQTTNYSIEKGYLPNIEHKHVIQYCDKIAYNVFLRLLCKYKSMVNSFVSGIDLSDVKV